MSSVTGSFDYFLAGGNIIRPEVVLLPEARRHYLDNDGDPSLLYASTAAAAFDLRANLEKPICIRSGECVKVGTGLKIWLRDPRFAAHIIPRSGLGNRGIVLGNLVGLIDSDYQGELLVSVWNRGPQDFYLNPGERFAQYYALPVFRVQPVFVEEFSNTTERGEGGFNSTGTK